MERKQTTKTTANTNWSSMSDGSTFRSLELSEDAFSVLFNPLPNLFNPNASFDWGDGYGTLFSTYGEEIDLIRTLPTKHVWTLLSCDEGDLIASGFHFFNRLGYFVCERPVPDRNGTLFVACHGRTGVSNRCRWPLHYWPITLSGGRHMSC